MTAFPPMTWPADDPLLTMWQLTEAPSAAAEARLALRSWLSGLRIDTATGTGADLILSASELVANAVVHGKPPVWLAARVELAHGYVPVLVVSVTDGGGSDVAPSGPAGDSESGRGLGIVAALAAWSEISVEWNATQVRAGFPVPGLSVPHPRHAGGNAPSGTVKSGTRPGCPPRASLSAQI